MTIWTSGWTSGWASGWTSGCGSPPCLSSGRHRLARQVVGFLGCLGRACRGPSGCWGPFVQLLSRRLSGGDCTLVGLLIQTKPSVTCGICLMFVCLFSLHLYFISLFVCFGFLSFQVLLGCCFGFYVSSWRSISILCLCRFLILSAGFCYIVFPLVGPSFRHSSLCRRHARRWHSVVQ